MFSIDEQKKEWAHILGLSGLFNITNVGWTLKSAAESCKSRFKKFNMNSSELNFYAIEPDAKIESLQSKIKNLKDGEHIGFHCMWNKDKGFAKKYFSYDNTSENEYYNKENEHSHTVQVIFKDNTFYFFFINKGVQPRDLNINIKEHLAYKRVLVMPFKADDLSLSKFIFNFLEAAQSHKQRNLTQLILDYSSKINLELTNTIKMNTQTTGNCTTANANCTWLFDKMSRDLINDPNLTIEKAYSAALPKYKEMRKKDRTDALEGWLKNITHDIENDAYSYDLLKIVKLIFRDKINLNDLDDNSKNQLKERISDLNGEKVEQLYTLEIKSGNNSLELNNNQIEKLNKQRLIFSHEKDSIMKIFDDLGSKKDVVTDAFDQAILEAKGESSKQEKLALSIEAEKNRNIIEEKIVESPAQIKEPNPETKSTSVPSKEEELQFIKENEAQPHANPQGEKLNGLHKKSAAELAQAFAVIPAGVTLLDAGLSANFEKHQLSNKLGILDTLEADANQNTAPQQQAAGQQNHSTDSKSEKIKEIPQNKETLTKEQPAAQSQTITQANPEADNQQKTQPTQLKTQNTDLKVEPQPKPVFTSEGEVLITTTWEKFVKNCDEQLDRYKKAGYDKQKPGSNGYEKFKIMDHLKNSLIDDGVTKTSTPENKLSNIVKFDDLLSSPEKQKILGKNTGSLFWDIITAGIKTLIAYCRGTTTENKFVNPVKEEIKSLNTDVKIQEKFKKEKAVLASIKKEGMVKEVANKEEKWFCRK